MTDIREPQFFAGIDRKRRALAVGAVEDQPLGALRRLVMQHAAGRDMALELRIGHPDRAGDGAAARPFLVAPQIDQQGVGAAGGGVHLLAREGPGRIRLVRLATCRGGLMAFSSPMVRTVSPL